MSSHYERSLELYSEGKTSRSFVTFMWGYFLWWAIPWVIFALPVANATLGAVAAFSFLVTLRFETVAFVLLTLLKIFLNALVLVTLIFMAAGLSFLIYFVICFVPSVALYWAFTVVTSTSFVFWHAIALNTAIAAAIAAFKMVNLKVKAPRK